MTARGEKDYFGTEKRIIAVKIIFWYTHVGLHIYFMKLAFKQSGSLTDEPTTSL
jgi:hypothetical protein